MRTIIFLFCLLFLAHDSLLSQVLPREGSKLNYRLVGFSFPATEPTGNYVLEIAKGNFDNEPAFLAGIIKSVIVKSGKTIVELPSFGADYTWHTVYKKNNAVATTGPLHHFSIMTNLNVDTGNIRLRVLEDNSRYKDTWIMADFSQTIYDMAGNPIWFYPDPTGLTFGTSNVRDMKLTRDGTLTLIAGDKAREVDYNGKIVWEGPNKKEQSGDTLEHYHHEFTKLANGHYMVLGAETVIWMLPRLKEDGPNITNDSTAQKANMDSVSEKVNFGTVEEYDAKGKIVWSWKSSAYFRQSDLFQYQPGQQKLPFKDVHENAFYFDEKAKAVYVGFRDISRILKVSYPAGKVIGDYGARYKSGMDDLGTKLFCGQHSINKSKDGYLLVYNNNAFTGTEMPKLEMLKEPAKGKGDLAEEWEYQCTMEGIDRKQMDMQRNKMARMSKMKGKNSFTKIRMTSGGNFIELPDGHFLASINSPFSKIFIINRKKEMIWCALLERKNAQDSTWSALPVYRANIITSRESMEKFIWNVSETAK